MKNKILLIGLLFCINFVMAQEQSQHHLFVGNASVDYKSESNNLNMQMQIGGALPYFVSENTSADINPTFGFPYNVLYISPTFVIDKFEVSKGYYPDRVQISWQYGNNQERITSTEIYRRRLGSNADFEFLGTVNNAFEYQDRQIEGGVLFEYQVRAIGIPITNGAIGNLHTNYIQGIGYRNPTATVSGSVTYEGGTPVQDVTVFAESIGAINNTTTALDFTDTNSFAEVNAITNLNADAITLQFWVNKKVAAFNTTGSVLEFTSKQDNDIGTTKTYTIDAGFVGDNNFTIGLLEEGIPLSLAFAGHYIPSGQLNAAGDDVLEKISDINENMFVNVSVILEKNKEARFFINGRELNEAYKNYISSLKPGVDFSFFGTFPQNNYVYTAQENEKISRIKFQGDTNFKIDEFRAWSRVITNKEIRRDYRRYLSGGENGLAIYLRMDEGIGNYLYDLSRDGFTQNKNDAFITNIDVSNPAIVFTQTKPTQQQLGVFGVTDQNGSYIISAIGYKGTGESFVITPSLGVHQFNPPSQTLFLGTEEPVVNQLNFTDISSFKFNGRVVYNVQDVFQPIETSSPTSLKDFGYNKYQLGNTIINKGEYYYEGGSKNENSGFYKDGVLKRYPVIGVEGANVLIDGNIVLDEDNQPVVTDADGNFTINVPIGNHKVEVQKDGHTFELKGRFPETGTFEFFEDALETQYFIDDTRVTLVGKVVGGKKEFDKPIGFGVNGKYTQINFEGTENESEQIVSAVNNIGTAQITFKGDVNSSTLDKIITTNPESGEYKVELIPYIYQILPNGITIPSNTDITVLASAETLNLVDVSELSTSEFTTLDDTTLESDPYHFEKSFRYNSEVSLVLINQEHETEIQIGGTTFDISNLDVPIYNQRTRYTFIFEVIQKYVNKDDARNPLETKEFFREGTFNITNNFAANGSENVEFGENQYQYTFLPGLPNITQSDGFSESINIEYVISGQDPIEIENIEDFKSKGIIKGGRPSDGKTFVTTAPERPSIILRDPPGSNSFASIERGTSISYEERRIDNTKKGIGGGYFISVGPDFEKSIGLGPVAWTTTYELVAETSGTFSKETQSIDDNTTRNTFTFNQTISTSDDPRFVGAEGDLYIGNARNIFYGIFDNMFVTTEVPRDLNNDIIPNITVNVVDDEENPATLYISSYKDYIIAEQETNTFFTYSQKFLLETLIPELEGFAANPPTSTNPEETRSAEFYRAQADLWKKVIQSNEKSKHDALTNKAARKDTILNRVQSKFSKSAHRARLNELLDKEFFSNRSFDAGLGEFTNSVTTTFVETENLQTVIDISDEFQTELGAFYQGVGATLKMNNSFNNIDDDTDTDDFENTTTISYTLKDNDKDNALSVDVVNLFDGNGPVFITKGGATSCPYEDKETAVFFNLDGYDPEVSGTGGTVLSEATNRVYAADFSVEKELITNVPEDDSAIFKVLLKNTSQTQSNLEFVLDFDPTSLNGAEINLETNGVNVFLPFNETIEFPIEISKSSSSSTYNYENIRLYLYSPCAVEEEKRENFLDISVQFKKSCSNVVISSPENNWIFNNNEAYSTDVNGNQTTNTLPITFTDFNADFNGFQKIELQYRNASSSNWTKLASYYGSEDLRANAGDTEGIVINNSDTEFTYNWNIVNKNIPDGDYEFRAISFCTDNIVNSSEIISGIINLNAPVVFGTPQPTDGILDLGEDIAVRFNEDIFERTSTSIVVTGLQNQQEIKHDVSVFIDGSSNQIELPNQRLGKESFTLQFWYKNATTDSGLLVSQENGINVKVDGNHLEFSVGGEIISTLTDNNPIDGSRYNFYSFVYQNGASPQLLLFENGKILEERTLTQELDINTSSSIFIGGQNVMGNIHDIRLWSKPFTPAQATVAKDVTLTGRELNLLGYWKLDEGFGTSALDKAKRRNAIVNLDWTIFPKGTGYEFRNNEYLTLNSAGFIQPTNFEDMTLSFWIKPSETSAGTIFSNGKGDNSETILTNGFRNKWAVNMTSSGHLELAAEDEIFPITNNALPANTWSHVAITLRRGGSLNAYINGNEEVSVSSAKIGGFTGNKILIGARLFTDISTNETIDNHFTGKLDELRFWNTARSIDQIKRDRYFEIDKETEGLLLYVDFNEDTTNTSNGPAYHHADINLTTGTTFALLNGASQNFVQDSPPIKPPLKYTNIPFSTVINGDEMIIQPELTTEEWSLFEGEIINFSVARLSDTHFNTQQSPVTWSTLVNRQELEWYTEKQTKEIVTQKTVGQEFSFTMDVVNIGNSNQPFTISGIPTWLQTEITSGTINPNATRQITFTVDKDLAMGNYTSEIFLETASGFNDRLSFSLRVLADVPDWSVNPRDFLNSMNAIGKIELDGVFSRDQYTKVGAFINDEKRGEAYLVYDTFYDSYFAYLTIYSNNTDTNITEEVTFKIWDAVNGKIIAAAIDGTAKINFLQNEVLGSSANPKIFSATNLAEQNLALNVGWSWVSFFADDSRFNDLEATLNSLELSNGDAVKSQSQFVNREDGIWQGDLKTFDIAKMYKIKLAKNNNLRLKGTEIDPANFTLNIAGKADPSDTPKWNWLPFPIHRNIALQEALAFYNAADGDVIKDQFSFAIYDVNSGWRGTLNYLESGQGYMLKSSNQQTFKYPNTEVLQKTATNKMVAKNNTDNNTNFAQYSSNMSIVAEVISDDNYTKVMVYDANDVLRGVADITNINGKKYSFITAFSNKTETLKFVLANAVATLDINKNFTFKDNDVLGDFSNPIQLSSKALTTDSFVLNDAVLYPNPFTNQITVDLSNENIKISKVDIFNTIGVTVLSKKVTNANKTVLETSNLSNGIYLIRLTNNKGAFVIKKMIKK